MIKYYLDKYRYIDSGENVYCRKCGATMKLRTPKETDNWRPFWGCKRYPDCDGSKEPVILDDRYKQDKMFGG